MKCYVHKTKRKKERKKERIIIIKHVHPKLIKIVNETHPVQGQETPRRQGVRKVKSF